MPKMMHAIFAERVIIDRFTNELNIVGMIEQLSAVEPPPAVIAKAQKEKKVLAGTVRMMLLIHWRRSDPAKPEGKYTSRILIVGPTGKIVGKATQDIHLREHVYMRNVLPLDKLPIVGQGTYTVRVDIRIGSRWRRAGDTSIEVIYQRPAPEGAKLRIH